MPSMCNSTFIVAQCACDHTIYRQEIYQAVKKGGSMPPHVVVSFCESACVPQGSDAHHSDGSLCSLAGVLGLEL